MRVVVWVQERAAFSFVVHISDCTIQFGWYRVAETEASIVEDLRYQDNIGESVIDSQNNHGRQNALQNCPKYIKDISS